MAFTWPPNPLYCWWTRSSLEISTKTTAGNSFCLFMPLYSMSTFATTSTIWVFIVFVVFEIWVWDCCYWAGRPEGQSRLLTGAKNWIKTQYPTGLQPNHGAPWNSVSHPPLHVMLAPFLSFSFDVNVWKETSRSLSASIRRSRETLPRSQTLLIFSVCRYTICQSSFVLRNGGVISSLTRDHVMLPQLAGFEPFTIAVWL